MTKVYTIQGYDADGRKTVKANTTADFQAGDTVAISDYLRGDYLDWLAQGMASSVGLQRHEFRRRVDATQRYEITKRA